VLTTEADSLAELIADCADIPVSVLDCQQRTPLPPLAPRWEVTDVCHAQVRDLDEYV
jgi:hypothetical protein